MIRIGESIPDLTVTVFHENDVKDIPLASLQGRWVVMVFYPADFTFICPTELEELAENYAKFKELGAEVLSVSTDTVFVHKAWKDTSKAIAKIEFPMVADPTGILCKTMGTYIDDDGLALRGTFIFDDQGVLKSFEMNDNSIGRNTKELLRKLEAAIYVSNADGEVCPASWEPGKKTLSPGLDLVGKI